VIFQCDQAERPVSISAGSCGEVKRSSPRSGSRLSTTIGTPRNETSRSYGRSIRERAPSRCDGISAHLSGSGNDWQYHVRRILRGVIHLLPSDNGPGGVREEIMIAGLRVPIES